MKWLSKIDIRDRVIEPFSELQERARRWWTTLNNREKLILSIAMSAVALLLTAVMIKEVYGLFTYYDRRVAENIQNIKSIRRLTDELRSQRSDLLRYEQLKGRSDDLQDLRAFVENEAGRAGVSLKKITPTRPKAGTEGGDSELLEVVLGDSTSLSAALTFLDAIERTLGLRLLEVSMKPKFTDPSQLEVTAVIAKKASD